MDPSFPKPSPAQAQTRPAHDREPVFDTMQQNENSGTAMTPLPPVDGVQSTTSFAQPQPQPLQEQAGKSTPNLFCCCELRVGLGVMAGIEVAVQFMSFALTATMASDYLKKGRFTNCLGGALDCKTFFIVVLFFSALALVSSIVLLISTWIIQKTVTAVSYLVGWIPFLSSVIIVSLESYDSEDTLLTFTVIVALLWALWRIYEGVVVYYYWKEIPGQYATSRNQGQANNTYGAYGTPSVAPPAGYNYDAGGYRGFGQPGYGGYAGYGEFSQPVGGDNHV